MATSGRDYRSPSVIENTIAMGRVWAIIAGRTLILRNTGCSARKQFMFGTVNPSYDEPPTGEPDAGEREVRFGGRGDRETGLS